MSEEVKEEGMNLEKLKVLLKEEGLDMAEDALAKAYKCCSQWAIEECPKHSNGVIKMLPGILLALDPVIQDFIDKIDGEVG
jgi:hypothetical protein